MNKDVNVSSIDACAWYSSPAPASATAPFSSQEGRPARAHFALSIDGVLLRSRWRNVGRGGLYVDHNIVSHIQANENIIYPAACTWWMVLSPRRHLAGPLIAAPRVPTQMKGRGSGAD